VTVRARLVVPTALAVFVGLGAFDSALGVAWPSIRREFDLPLSWLGLLLLAGGLGYLVSTTGSGPTVARLGTRPTLVLAAGIGAVALALYALTPRWWGIIPASVLLGLAGGAIDAGLNSFVALRYPVSVMNLLHASWGGGALVAPLLVTAVIVHGGSWRLAYVALAALQVVLLVALLPQADGWREPKPVPDGGGPDGDPGGRHRGWTLALWLGLVIFFVYTGAENAAGSWSYSLLTEARGLERAAGGLVVSAYWGALTAGRLAAAAISPRLGAEALLRVSMAVSLAGAALFWWDPLPALGAAGLALLGAGLAPVFPSLVSLTPSRVGAHRTGHIVGYQLAAAWLGGAGLPALAGPVLQRWGLEVLAPMLLACVGVMAALELVVSRL
jgi:fucose permease